ncbi:MAG: hypothetical protein AB7S38_40875 [Vulcanimicrobiota bacterium]
MSDRVPLDQTVEFGWDWFGRPRTFGAWFRCGWDGQQLSFEFGVDKTPECDPHPHGSFRQELWKQDVAEIFVADREGRYQEFNVSPSGAWWSALFRGYRQLEREVSEPPLELQAEGGVGVWWVKLRVKPALELHKLNLTAILRPSDPVYLCLGHRSGGEPDFHRADNFLPLADSA